MSRWPSFGPAWLVRETHPSGRAQTVLRGEATGLFEFYKLKTNYLKPSKCLDLGIFRATLSSQKWPQ